MTYRLPARKDLTTHFVSRELVKRKITPIILSKLDEKSTQELRAMEVELSSVKLENAGDTAKPPGWGRRFAASGKPVNGPKLRFVEDLK